MKVQGMGRPEGPRRPEPHAAAPTTLSGPAAQACVRHTDPTITAALGAYTDGLDRGTSILVRPKAAFVGLDQVAEAVAGVAGGRLLVTDLESPCYLIESAMSPTSQRTSRRARIADDAAAEPTAGESVVALHTSGSTGTPKCVVYRLAQVRSHAAAVIDALDLDDSHAFAALTPPRFAYGLSIVESHHLAGVPVTFTAADWMVPGVIQIAAADPRPLALYVLPQHTPLLLASTLPGDRLARLLVAGGRLSRAAAAALARRFPAMRLTNMYGQAEMGPRLATWDGSPADFTEGLIGRPIAGVTLDVASLEPPAADDLNRARGHATAGELLARSEHAMSWVLRAPYDRLEDFAGRHELQRTGDLGARLPSGQFRHDGRADHILNVAGTKVDVGRVVAIVQEVARPLFVSVSSRPTRLGGDVVPVIEIVPDGPAPRATAPIRRALHAEFGSLAALFTVTYVDRPTVKESGK